MTKAERLELLMSQANENDWLVTKRPTREELFTALQNQGDNIPSLDGTRKLVESHNFGLRSKRWRVEKERFASICLPLTMWSLTQKHYTGHLHHRSLVNPPAWASSKTRPKSRHGS